MSEDRTREWRARLRRRAAGVLSVVLKLGLAALAGYAGLWIVIVGYILVFTATGRLDALDRDRAASYALVGVGIAIAGALGASILDRLRPAAVWSSRAPLAAVLRYVGPRLGRYLWLLGRWAVCLYLGFQLGLEAASWFADDTVSEEELREGIEISLGADLDTRLGLPIAAGILAGALVASGAVFPLTARTWRLAKATAHSRLALAGIALTLLGGGVAWWALDQDLTAYRFAAPELLFVTDAPLPPARGKPFPAPELDVTVGVDPSALGGCNPAVVTATATGLRSFAPEQGPLKWALAWRGPPGRIEVRSLRYDFNREQDVSKVEVSSRRSEEPEFERDPFLVRIRFADVGTIHGAFEDGEEIPDQLTVEFEAQWAARRDAGSCWVRLPALVGDVSLAAGAAAAHLDAAGDHPARRSARAGTTELVPAPVLSTRDGDAVPPPDALETRDRGPHWTCKMVRDGRRWVAEEERSCGARVVAEDPGLADSKAFAIFLAGALASLGFQLVAEAFRDQRRPRSPT